MAEARKQATAATEYANNILAAMDTSGKFKNIRNERNKGADKDQDGNSAST